MCNLKFLFCEHCGNIVDLVNEGAGTMMCCGDEMKEMVANTQDASLEKHVPVVEVNGNTVTVTVGSVLHPMLPEHHIAWIVMETNQGVHRKCLPVDGEPVAKFALSEGEEFVAAYEFCNLHGLWKKEA